MLHIMVFFFFPCWWVTVTQQAALKSSFKALPESSFKLVFFFSSKIHFTGLKKGKKFKQGTHLWVAALLKEKVALENSAKWDMTKKKKSQFLNSGASRWTFLTFLKKIIIVISAHSQSCCIYLQTLSCHPVSSPQQNPCESGHRMCFTPGALRCIPCKFMKEKLLRGSTLY